MGIPIFSQKSNRWREFYNPLRGLSLPKLVSLMEAGERGQYADLQWLYYYMERSDPMIFSILQRRRAALLDSDWDVRKVSIADCRLPIGECKRIADCRWENAELGSGNWMGKMGTGTTEPPTGDNAPCIQWRRVP